MSCGNDVVAMMAPESTSRSGLWRRDREIVRTRLYGSCGHERAFHTVAYLNFGYPMALLHALLFGVADVPMPIETCSLAH